MRDRLFTRSKDEYLVRSTVKPHVANATITVPMPYISAVISSRNDDHSGGMYERMRACFLGFIAQAERHKLSSELIIVDWNPPTDRPLLKDIFPWPVKTQYCTVRTIVVPPEVHNSYAYGHLKHLNPTEAQNVGIRRARGKYILSTTADILFSDEFFGFLAAQQLCDDRYYRADRVDVDSRVVATESFEEQLRFCQQHQLRVFTEFGVVPIRPDKRVVPHSRIGIRSFRRDGRGSFPLLHTNGPDFFLMSKARFELLHGWPDVGISGIHADSLICYMAVASGAAQEILPLSMGPYHIEHGSTWQTTQGLVDRLLRKYRPRQEFLRRLMSRAYWRFKKNERPVNAAGVPYLSGYEYRKMAADMLKGTRPFVFNDDAWGLKNVPLAEFVIVAAQYDRATQANAPSRPV